MGTVVTTDVVNGTLTDAGVMNANFGSIKAAINGALDNTNLAANAGIAPSKLAPSPNEGDVIRSVGGVAAWSAPAGGGGGAGGGVPVGTGVDYWGTAAPAGWLFCDGSAVSRTTYAALFTAIGTTYGPGDGSTTFNLPDKQGRVSVAKGTHADVDTVGDSDAAVLADRRPAHKHTVNDPGHAHTYYQGGGNSVGGTRGNYASYDYAPGLARGDWIAAALTGITVGPQAAVPVDAPSYLVCNYIIFAGV